MKPLFVLGVHRSGTTWVANALCNHSRIFGVQSPAYGGIKESWFFSHLDGRFGDLTHAENYMRFLQVFQHTAFFQVSGVSSAFLRSLKPRDYADFFDRFMQEAALQKPHVTYWLEKTPVHTLYLEHLTCAYPAARFVAIQRGFAGVLLSSWHLKKQNPPAHAQMPLSYVLKVGWHWLKYQRYIQHYAGRFPARFFTLHYEQVVKDPEAHFRAAVSFLELEWEESVLELSFPPNTSFENDSHSFRERLHETQPPVPGFIEAIGKYIPFFVFSFQERLRKPRNKEVLPSIMI